MSARLSDYDYVLPRELIAQRPLERRQDSRMMVLHRARQKIEHRQFRRVKDVFAAERPRRVKQYARGGSAAIL